MLCSHPRERCRRLGLEQEKGGWKEWMDGFRKTVARIRGIGKVKSTQSISG